MGILKPNMQNLKQHIIETTASIPTKFCTTIKTTKCFSWVVLTCAQQIQDGGWPPSWKSKNRDISVTVWPSAIKFSKVTHTDPLHKQLKLRHWQCHHLIEHIRLPIYLSQNYVLVLHHFWEITSYLSKVANFAYHTPVFVASVGSDLTGISPRSLAWENTAPGLLQCQVRDTSYYRERATSQKEV